MVGWVGGAVEQMIGRVGGKVTFRAEVRGVCGGIYPMEENIEVG